jgi:hypothetical protein
LLQFQHLFLVRTGETEVLTKDEEPADDEPRFEGTENLEHAQEIEEKENLGQFEEDANENFEDAMDSNDDEQLHSPEDVKNGFDSQREKVDALIKDYYENLGSKLDFIFCTRARLNRDFLLLCCPSAVKTQLATTATEVLGKQEGLMLKYVEITRTSRAKRTKFEGKCECLGRCHCRCLTQLYLLGLPCFAVNQFLAATETAQRRIQR